MDEMNRARDFLLINMATGVMCILDALTEAGVIKPSNEKDFKGTYFASTLFGDEHLLVELGEAIKGFEDEVDFGIIKKAR